MSRRNGGGHLDFDLNLAPIIDCLTVLIAFMLASASFLSITLFDAGFAAIDSPGDPNPPPVKVSLTLKKRGDLIQYQVVSKGKLNSDQIFDTPEQAGESLRQIRDRYPDFGAITISADDDVTYEPVVKAMEKIVPIVPELILGGF